MIYGTITEQLFNAVNFKIRNMATIKLSIRSKADKLVPIYIRLRTGQISQQEKTGYNIHPDDWDQKNEKAKNKSTIEKKEVFNHNLKTFKRHIEDEFIVSGEDVKEGWLKETIDKYHNPDKYKEKNTFKAFVEDFISRSNIRINPSTGRAIGGRAQKHYKRTAELLFEFNPNLDFEDITLDFYEDWMAFLQKKKKFATNTVGGFIKTLKVFLNDATNKGINSNLDFRAKKFKKVKEDVDNVYLNEQELEKLENHDFSENKAQERVRDLFLIACWTGLRFSDVSLLSEKNISDDYIKIQQQKTEEEVIIPIHPCVRRILDKYDGVLPTAISNQKFNDHLKTIAKDAGLKDKVYITRTEGGMKTTKSYFKHQKVSSHTARRSFATNLYKSGFPAVSIMKITGHKTEAAFLLYVKANNKEHANLLAEHWRKQKVHLKKA